jgi:hypothetical protein
MGLRFATPADGARFMFTGRESFTLDFASSLGVDRNRYDIIIMNALQSPGPITQAA